MNTPTAPASIPTPQPHRDTAPLLAGGPPREAAHHALRQVVVYDDLESGQDALQVAARLTGTPVGAADAKPVFWHFNLMEYPAWRIWATADVIGSDVLILTTHSDAGLPEGLMRWLKDCTAQKQGTTATVVAVFGPPGRHDGPDSTRLKEVRQLVEGAGLRFLAPNARERKAFDTVTTNLHAREETVTPTLAGILERPRCLAH